MREEVSNATLRNWQKLHVDKSNKLLSRANKSRSRKLVLPTSYLPEYHLEDYISHLLSLPYRIDDIIYSLCVYRLSIFGLIDKKHVQQTFAEYNRYQYIPEIESKEILTIEKDILGYIYQAMTPEGERNKSGKYYTLEHIVSDMTSDICLSNDKRFLDPCYSENQSPHSLSPQHLLAPYLLFRFPARHYHRDPSNNKRDTVYHIRLYLYQSAMGRNSPKYLPFGTHIVEGESLAVPGKKLFALEKEGNSQIPVTYFDTQHINPQRHTQFHLQKYGHTGNTDS